MPTWIVFAAIASIAVTAALTWLLRRINSPRSEPRRSRGDGGADAAIVVGGADARERADFDGGSASGGDGGGD